jgi:hypothetical protein
MSCLPVFGPGARRADVVATEVDGQGPADDRMVASRSRRSNSVDVIEVGGVRSMLGWFP